MKMDGELNSLNSVFDFGKNEGKKVKDVLKEDPMYIAWCLHNIDWFKIDTDATTVYENAIRELAISKVFDKVIRRELGREKRALRRIIEF